MTLRHKGIACDACLITNNQYWYAKVNYITRCDQYLISKSTNILNLKLFQQKVQRHSVLHQKVLNSILVQQTVYFLYSYIIFFICDTETDFIDKISTYATKKKLAAGK